MIDNVDNAIAAGHVGRCNVGVVGFLADFPEGASPSQPHQHGVEEIVYLLVGTLCITVDGEVRTLREGDAILFQSNTLHSYERQGDGPCKAVVVTVG